MRIGPYPPRTPLLRMASNVSRERIRPTAIPSVLTTVSSRKPLASLQTARANNGPAGLCRHPLPEPVRLGTLPHVGLVCPFHNPLPSSPSTADSCVLCGRGARHNDMGSYDHRRRELGFGTIRPPSAMTADTVYRSEHGRRARWAVFNPPPSSTTQRRYRTDRAAFIHSLNGADATTTEEIHRCGWTCGPNKVLKGGGPRERHRRVVDSLFPGTPRTGLRSHLAGLPFRNYTT